MTRSTVGEKGGWLNDEDAVDALKVTFFVGSFVAFYKMLKTGAALWNGVAGTYDGQVRNTVHTNPVTAAAQLWANTAAGYPFGKPKSMQEGKK